MAVTLAQWAIDNRAQVSPQQGALIMMLDQISPIFSIMPMDKIDGLFYDYERVGLLPAVAWRSINSGYTESTGVTNPFREYLKILGGEAKVDIALLRASPANGASLLQKQIKLKLQAAANEWERAFLEGSELNNVNEMVGLRARISGGQLIQQASGGGTLTLAKLNALIDAVPFTPRGGEVAGIIKRGEGVTKCLFMNRTVYGKINALIEASTGSRQIQISKDEFGRYTAMYRDCQIVVVEQSGNAGVTTLDFDEDPGDGTADTASIYCVAFGDGLVHGLYNNGSNSQGMPILMDVEQFGTGTLGMESAPIRMVRFEGSYGISIDHPRSAARLYAITNT
jgi:hypothetical protein